jgi:hypothetical protein
MADHHVKRIRRLRAQHDIYTYRFERRRRHREVVVGHAGPVHRYHVSVDAIGLAWSAPVRG